MASYTVTIEPDRAQNTWLITVLKPQHFTVEHKQALLRTKHFTEVVAINKCTWKLVHRSREEQMAMLKLFEILMQELVSTNKHLRNLITRAKLDWYDSQ